MSADVQPGYWIVEKKGTRAVVRVEPTGVKEGDHEVYFCGNDCNYTIEEVKENYTFIRLLELWP